jgi:hypothetical protein
MLHREITVVVVTTTHRVQSALNFFMSAIFICLGYSQIFELFHTFKGFITNHHAVILSCIPFMRHTHILIRNYQQYVLICNTVYSMYLLLHVSAVACHHQGAS